MSKNFKNPLTFLFEGQPQQIEQDEHYQRPDTNPVNDNGSKPCIYPTNRNAALPAAYPDNGSGFPPGTYPADGNGSLPSTYHTKGNGVRPAVYPTNDNGSPHLSTSIASFTHVQPKSMYGVQPGTGDLLNGTGVAQLKRLTLPFHNRPAIPSTGVPATPFQGIQPATVDPHKRDQVERYVQWLHTNNILTTSQEKLQAYQDAALEIKKIGKGEVRTFAPFQAHTSALQVITSDQITILAMLAIYWFIGLLILHVVMFTITIAVVTLLYICGFITSATLATSSFNSSSGEKIDEEIIVALDQKGVEWPTYTILCPLYKETAIAPQFVEAIKALHYPVDKLQVLFLTEENDNETRAALYSMQLPPGFTVLTVPKGSPQTKPRACNFGLLQAKGQFIVIFDAEDKPEPYQLKKAVLTFASHGPEIACVQAKLNYYNSKQNLLTRWFTAEYSTWFDIMLPGLQRIGFALPLGGTSNHFRTEVLRSLGGWDAFNVTEDCDLGLRITQYKLITAVLDSTTYEEATSRLKSWLFQRSRWIKGYLQTYLVHMRHPLRTLQKGHLRKFFSLQLIVGAWTVVLLINPIMWALTLFYILFRPVQLYSILFPGPILYMGAFCLIFGNFFYIYIHLIGCLWRKEYGLIKWILLLPLYWVMMSISAYIAFYQLIVKPHYWEKTQHGNHLTTSARVQASTFLPDVEHKDHAIAVSMPTTRLFAITVGRAFKHIATLNELGTTTQRVSAVRSTLSTTFRQGNVRRQTYKPHIRDLWLITEVIIAFITSVSACYYYFQQHEILLYGDALSHMRISRSVFDSATPGLAQLGSVWLPLQHILMWPFIWENSLWHSGLAGSFVSMPCYVITSIYLFLSARRLTRSSIASFIGTLAFIFNPNVLYLQSVPLSETVCMATLAMAGYYFLCWAQDGKPKQLIFAAACTFLATLGRYDGWALFIGLCCCIPIISLMKHQKLRHIEANLVVFGVLGSLGIVLWLAWNKIIFGDPLYFQKGAYSSQAQQLEVLSAHKLYTYHNLWQALRFYVIDSQQTIGLLLFILAAIGVIWFILHQRFTPTTVAALVFLMPFPFYVTSLFGGQATIWLPGANPPGAPVYMYNVRYGAQMIVPVALFMSILIERMSRISFSRFCSIVRAVFVVIILFQTSWITAHGIISLQDGQFNYSCAPQQIIIQYLAEHYNGGKILQDVTTGAEVTQAGMNFQNIIYQGSGQLWLQSLHDPAGTVNWIVVRPGSKDLVAQHIDVNNSIFLAKFTLVVRQSDGILLYHRLGGPPLPNRPAPAVWKIPHHACS